LGNGRERVIASRPIRLRTPAFINGRNALLVADPDTNERSLPPSLHFVDLATGQFTPLAGSEPRRYVPNLSATEVAPDGLTLYAPADDRESSGVSFDRIVAIDIATGHQRLIASLPATGTARSVPASVGVAVSPDGRQLAIVGHLGDRDRNAARSTEGAELYVVNVDGTGFQEVYGPYVNRSSAKVAWTADSKAVYVVRQVDREDEGWEVLRVDPSIPAAPAVTVFSSISLKSLPEYARFQGAGLKSLAVSADGKHLLLSQGVNDLYEVWALENAVTASGQRQ
jgi:hypothetical protein